MRERYWGRNDFSMQGSLTASGLIEAPPHEEALARLGYLVAQRRRFGLMLGPPGTGKSLVLRAAADEAKRLGREVAVLDLFGIDSHDLLWELAVALRLGPTECCTHFALWRAVTDHWHALHSARVSCVLLLDHLERAESDCFGLIERLLHLDVANGGCLTVLAVARDGSDGLRLAELAAHSDLRIELPRLDQRESAAFVREMLVNTGRRRETFDRDALETLFDLSVGTPREIVRLCQLAWAAAERDDLDRIDSDMLLDAAGELPRLWRRQMSREQSLAAG